MARWHITADDRDEQGKIRIAPRTLADLLPALEDDGGDTQPLINPSWQQWISGALALVFLAFCMLFAAGRSAVSDRPLPPPTQTHAPTTAPAVLVRPTPTQAPSTPTPEPPPTDEPTSPPVAVASPEPTPCDINNPPYVVERTTVQGSVRGVSCVSMDDAQANADALIAEQRAAITATASWVPTMIVWHPPARPQPLMPPVVQDSCASEHGRCAPLARAPEQPPEPSATP